MYETPRHFQARSYPAFASQATMHRVVSSGRLSEESAPGAGYFSLDKVISKAFALPAALLAAYQSEEVWEALWQATLQTYQG